MESLVQPDRWFTLSETAEELLGQLEVPDRPEITAGYADIYHGIWTSPQGERVEVAVKQFKTLIPRTRQSDPETLQWKTSTRLKREAFIWSQTKHRNLHPLLGYLSQPQPRLISPWCHHGNLADFLMGNPSLSRLDKLRLIYQAAFGLEHLHTRSPPICHADIKPENVLINDISEATLSDFGLSRVLQGLGVPSGFTTSETVKGTRNYMAGEIFVGNKPTRESDVYAFGGLILTVMSGKPPFYDLHEPTILFRVMTAQSPRPEEHPNLPLSDPLWSLMRRCWDENPAARPQIWEILWELWACIKHEQSDLKSRAGLGPGDEAGSREFSDASLVCPPERERDGIRALPVLNPALTHDSESRITNTEKTYNPVVGGVSPAAEKIFRSLEVRSKVIPIIGRYMEAAIELGLTLLEIVQTIDRNQDIVSIMESNTLKIALLLDTLHEKWSRWQGDQIAACITDIRSRLNCVLEKFEEWDSSGLLLDALSCFGHPEGPGKSEGMVWKAREAMRLLVDLDIASLVTELENDEIRERHRRLLNFLGDGKYGAQGNVIEDVICVPGTRVDILDRIDTWIRDASTQDRVLWIRGMAGRGKSTIASTVVHHWKYRASCAIFHFRRGQNALDTRIVCALARQLGNSLVPAVKDAILESVRENADIRDQRLEEQFKVLFVSPFAKLKNQLHPILIVVDALDECDDAGDALDFIKLINQHSLSFPPNVKFLLTCRPEAPLLRTLEPKQWREEDLDAAANVFDDLARFFRHAFTQIRDDYHLPEDWPSRGDIGRLVEMSQGLFQWARTAVMYVTNGLPVDRLRSLLQRPSTWSGLDDLYHQILSKAFENVASDPMRQGLLRSVLGTLVVAPYPVSLEILATLHGKHEVFGGVTQEEVIQSLHEDILADLSSLLHIPSTYTQPILLMHTSIRDLMVSEHRCKQQSYYIDLAQHHQQMADLCLKLMLRSLKENICNVSDLSKANSEIQDVLEREVSTAIRYCCRAWSVHLTQGVQWLESEPCASLLADFRLFSKEKLLCWLEVMSLVGATADAMIMAGLVHQWLLQCPRETFVSDSLTTLWNDAQRFIAAFEEPISFGPLHIYASALPHCPLKTELWECYHSRAKIRTVRGLQPLTWPANLWTRSAHVIVSTVAFSPDGTILASGCRDGQVQWLNTSTGTPFGDPLTGHSDGVLSVKFSPDGEVLASGSHDKTIRMWDVPTGVPLGEPLTGHGDWVHSIAFSPDGKVLASGSRDKTIRLWNARTGAPLGKPLTGHEDGVHSIVFSPDSKLLASGSEDGTIRLWDAQSEKSWGEPLNRHNGRIHSVAFSPDGKVLASGSRDKTIRLWNVQTGTPLGKPLIGHTYRVHSLAFSPDGKVLASGSGDRTIRLWNVQTWRPLGQLTGHTDQVHSVVFSPSSKLLASGSDDRTIRLWDVQSEKSWGEPSTGQEANVRTIALSPDGQILASGSRDNKIQLWNTQTGTPLDEPSIGHNGWVLSVAFSPDSMVLASGSCDKTIRLWNAKTGIPLGVPWTGHTDWVDSTAFSPGGKVLASGSYDNTIRLWDVQTGLPLGKPFKSHDSWVISVAFSPDGKALASVSEDGKIRLLDARTGELLGKPLGGHSGSVRCVAFSPDGMTVVAHSTYQQSVSWNTGTFQICEPLRKLPSHATLHFQDHWVTFLSSRLLWLPAQYWGGLYNSIILSNGRIATLSPGKIFLFDASRALGVD